MNALILKTMIVASVVNSMPVNSQPYLETTTVVEKNVTLSREASDYGGRYVDVQGEMDKYNESHNNWYAKCYTNTSSVSKTIRNRVDGTQVKNGILCDGQGRPLIGVGPAVVNKDRKYGCTDTISSDEMAYGTVVDVVLENNGERYYMECVIADCKAHTYPSGIVQTGYAPLKGEVYYTAPGCSDNYNCASSYSADKAKVYQNSAIEFVAVEGDLSHLSKYNIEGIIVYDNEKIIRNRIGSSSHVITCDSVCDEEVTCEKVACDKRRVF